jgi:AraC-like DNA-binding protein
MAAAVQASRCAIETLLPVIFALRVRGVDPQRVLEQVGLCESQLHDPALRIPNRQAQAFWERAAEASGDPAFGLHVAEGISPAMLNLFTYLASTSATPREACQRSSRYLRLINDALEINLRVDGSRSICTNELQGFPVTPSVAEYAIALMVRSAPIVMGGPGPIEAWFAHEEPDYVSEYHRVLGVPVRFGAPVTALVGESAHLDEPLPKADSALCRMLERHATELLARIPPNHGFAHAVRQRIAQELGSGNPGAEAVAEALGVSVRTLRRRLNDEGTSHQQLLDEVRSGLAQRMLGERGLSVNEVAFLLGFSDASAFHKALRRWTGRSAGESVREIRERSRRDAGQSAARKRDSA